MWTVYMAGEKEIYDNEYTKAVGSKDALSIHQEDWVECREEDLKMGDIIFAEYLPDSQKYIYKHFPEYGTVQEIGEDNTKTEVEVTILNHNGDLVKINKDHLSIYSRGYCLFLKKYKSNYKELPYPINDFSCTTCGRDHTED